jgi:hypothetical protein
MIAVIVSLLMTAGSAQDAAAIPNGPAEAIKMADAHPERGTAGMFRMKVVAVERTPYALYLNSNADYRSPDDLTFHIKPAAAHALEKRFGVKPEDFFRSKTVTVKGEVRAVPIVNTLAGRPHDLNRYQHSVVIARADQVIVVE